MLFRSSNINKLSDGEIIARYKKSGKNDLVGELFSRYSHLVLGVCLKYFKDEAESQDAVVNIFEKLMTDLHRHEIQNFRSWLHSVARNHCLMVLRERQAKEKKMVLMRAEAKQERAYDLHAEQDSEQQEKYAKEAQLTELEEAIKQLKPEQRTCIELFFLKEKCYNEIVEISGFTLKQVKSYLQNGKRNLKLILSNQNERVAT